MVLTENILIRKETMMQIQNINEKSFKKYGKILTQNKDFVHDKPPNIRL